jgi:hypothetical protein
MEVAPGLELESLEVIGGLEWAAAGPRGRSAEHGKNHTRKSALFRPMAALRFSLLRIASRTS